MSNTINCKYMPTVINL